MVSVLARHTFEPTTSDARIRLVIRLVMKGLREWCRIGGEPFMKLGLMVPEWPERKHAFE